ncbi:MAG: hypothetical protein KKF56_05020 [Nanoarchaeota archaeon]|nr:hypothetical protein [Nanoarchaeota archaeon]
MRDRYWITGVQLRMLKSTPNEKDREKLIKEINQKQFIGDLEVFNRIIDLSKSIQKDVKSKKKNKKGGTSCLMSNMD